MKIKIWDSNNVWQSAVVTGVKKLVHVDQASVMRSVLQVLIPYFDHVVGLCVLGIFDGRYPGINDLIIRNLRSHDIIKTWYEKVI